LPQPNHHHRAKTQVIAPHIRNGQFCHQVLRDGNWAADWAPAEAVTG
jgi:hypothetical protein